MKIMDDEAFRRLYDKQFNCIYRYTLALTGNPALAEEITQEAFTRFLGNGSASRGIERPEGWLMRVARNLAVESFRDQAKTRRNLREGESRNPEQQFLLNELQQAILQALSNLAESQRDCIALREFGGLAYDGIADILGISVDQVKVHLFRARRHLKRELEGLI